SYTLFIPSNEAVSRLPSNLVDHWRENNPDFTMALLNHVIQDVITLDQLKQGGRLTSRARRATIFVNNYNNEAVTVNGHRIVHGDVTAPKGGVIHVIDGTLCPVADQDIINTLRTCNKYDGFLTLADVTKLLDIMQDGRSREDTATPRELIRYGSLRSAIALASPRPAPSSSRAREPTPRIYTGRISAFMSRQSK
ncbi:hypothetical protein AVEN_96821-1, partial [Araneus ventricosus]